MVITSLILTFFILYLRYYAINWPTFYESKWVSESMMVIIMFSMFLGPVFAGLLGVAALFYGIHYLLNLWL